MANGIDSKTALQNILNSGLKHRKVVNVSQTVSIGYLDVGSFDVRVRCVGCELMGGDAENDILKLGLRIRAEASPLDDNFKFDDPFVYEDFAARLTLDPFSYFFEAPTESEFVHGYRLNGYYFDIFASELDRYVQGDLGIQWGQAGPTVNRIADTLSGLVEGDGVLSELYDEVVEQLNDNAK